MKFLGAFVLLVAVPLHAFDLPVVGIGRSGKKHEAYEKMKSWCDKNDGVMISHICRRVDSEVHCSYNTYLCSGICKIGEDAVTPEMLEGYEGL